MKKPNLPRIALLLCATTLLWLSDACHRVRIPDDVMQPDAMVSFLVDAYLIEGFYAIETNYDYQKVTPQLRASYDSVLARHHVTAEDFRRSMEFYVRHPDLNDTIHARAIRRLDAMQ